MLLATKLWKGNDMRGRPAKKINYETGEKLCPMCQTWKPFTEYYKKGKGISGGPYCQVCELERALTLQHDRRTANEILRLIKLDIKMFNWRKKYLKEKYGINCLEELI